MAFSFTGWGWVTPILCGLLVLGGGIAGFQTTHDWGLGPLVAAAIMVAGAGLNYLIGRAVNSQVTPQGRVWVERSTVNGVPMQVMSSLFLVFALVWLAVSIGHWTTGLIGFLFFVVACVAGIVYAIRAMRRAQPVR